MYGIACLKQLASCLIYARVHLYSMYVGVFCLKLLPSVKFSEDKVLTFLILREKNANIVQPWVLT